MHSQIKPTLPICLMQLTTFESRASSTRKDRASTPAAIHGAMGCLFIIRIYVTNKKYQKRELEKIKFVVKLILFDMNIVVILHLKNR